MFYKIVFCVFWILASGAALGGTGWLLLRWCLKRDPGGSAPFGDEPYLPCELTRHQDHTNKEETMQLSIPNILKYAGFAVVVGAAWFSPVKERVFLFIGTGAIAAGYLWPKIFPAKVS